MTLLDPSSSRIAHHDVHGMPNVALALFLLIQGSKRLLEVLLNNSVRRRRGSGAKHRGGCCGGDHKVIVKDAYGIVMGIVYLDLVTLVVVELRRGGVGRLGLAVRGCQSDGLAKSLVEVAVNMVAGMICLRAASC
jgi:hypothetical protein